MEKIKMNNKWTAKNIPDLSGKVFIVTGANSGIGFEAAKEFARNGAETILACRNMGKATKARDNIKKEIPDARVKVIQLDLASLRSIREFAEKFKKGYKRLDVLVNNAGIMAVPYQTTEDGFESHIGVNHLGHFALTALLHNVLLTTAGARVVTVSSNGHRMGKMDFNNFIYEGGKGYSRIGAYGRSKLANLLFTYELDKRFKKANIKAIAVAAHPGSSNTNLGRAWYITIAKMLLFFMTQSAAMGALPTIRAAVDPDVKGAEYYGPEGRAEMRGHPVKVESSEASHNKKDAKQLWDISEKLTGVKFSL
jgi:NAD(P)-dependent dehydrogenase (short-subunit alcohol dehydrogenase family)